MKSGTTSRPAIPNEHNPPIAGCTNTIMAQTSIRFQDIDKSLTFCDFTREEIQTHVANNQSCLTTQSITLQAPTGLSATAASTSQVDLSWDDNSTNETGFVAWYRLDGSADWVEIGTTAANGTTFSHGGLLAGATYRYRVRAFNETESSAFSNEAVGTTQAGEETGAEWIIETIAGGGIGDNGPAKEARLAPSPRGGGRRLGQPLHRRFQEQPDPEGGYLGNRHHHRGNRGGRK